MSINIPQVQAGDRNVNQLQQNIKSAVEPVFSEDFGSFVGVCSGFVGSVSTVVDWQTGTTQNGVMLSFRDLLETSNAATFTISGLPTPLFPKKSQGTFIRAVDNSINYIGLIEINPDGTIVIFKDISGGSFTASGAKGLGASCICYVRGI